MFQSMHGSSEQYISTFEHPLTSAQRQLDELVERIEECKFELTHAALVGEQAMLAKHLVSTLDQGVDELATHLGAGLLIQRGGACGVQIFNESVGRLMSICSQLSTAIQSCRSPAQMA